MLNMLCSAAPRRRKADTGAYFLPEVDLAGLLEDAYSLAEVGELGITTFLALLR